MIGSWRGLVVAAVIAVALAAGVIVDVARTPPAPASRALVPGLDPARVTELIWEPAGRPAFRAARAGDRWELRAPAAVPADPGAIGEVLAALRGGRWHRRGEPRPARATLTVVAGAERHAIGLAGPIAGTEQSWIVADGRGLVVDRWIARALDRDPLALRIRRPLAEAAAARSIAIAGTLGGGPPVDARAADLQIEGTPRRLVRPEALLLSPEIAGELERALGEVTIVRIPDGMVTARGLAIRVTGAGQPPAEVAIEVGGDCPGAPGLTAVSGTAGDGCIEAGAAAAVERAVARLQQPPAAIAEPRPIPFEPQQLVLADAATLDTSPPRIGGVAADPGRVAELLAALAAPARVVALPPGPPTGRIVARDRAGGSITLDLFGGHALARHGEPVALAPAPGAFRALVRPSRELRDPALWLEEPTLITTLVIDDVRYQRGQVIGTWTRTPVGTPVGTIDAARVEALATRLAAPRSLGFADGPVAVAHRVTIELTPPVGAVIRHALELGAPRGTVCPARAGRDTVLLPAALCAEVEAVVRRPPARPRSGEVITKQTPRGAIARRQRELAGGDRERMGSDAATVTGIGRALLRTYLAAPAHAPVVLRRARLRHPSAQQPRRARV